MQLQELSNHGHSALLEKVNRLPFSDARIYKKSLSELYEKYNEQLNSLIATIASYEEIELLVREQQPLVDKRQYARVRRREPVLYKVKAHATIDYNDWAVAQNE